MEKGKENSFREKLQKLEFFFNKNKKIVSIAGTAVVVFVLSIIAYKYYLSSQNEQAQREMFQAVYYFEADSLNKALKGDGNNLGFEDIIQDYSSTKAGNLVRFYVGVIYLKKGEFQKAIENLEKFSSKDILVQARAYCLLGDAHMELAHYQEAAEYYHRASTYKENNFFSPQYLLKEALASEKNKNYAAAIEACEKIIQHFYSSREFGEAKKNKARLESILATTKK